MRTCPSSHSRPSPGRVRSEGVEAKTTKSGKSRKVPLADDRLPFVKARMAGRGAGEPLRRVRFFGWLAWHETGQGRSIHDLRRTAVCV